MNRVIAIISQAIIAIAGYAAINGSWWCRLDISPSTSLPISINIQGDSCTLDSPFQGATGIPASIKYLDDKGVDISVESIGVKINGTIHNDTIIGTFRQGFYKQNVILAPGKPVYNRPQTPKPPFLYTTKEITLCPSSDTKLSGTLTYPMIRRKSVPIVIMISGSGQQNRDEEIMQHKPFAVIADHLAKSGIASFRYDDRGTGNSTGFCDTITMDNEADDLRHIIDHISQMGEFANVGILGHSAGATIAFMLGAEQRPDFIISMAGASTRGDSILLYQNRRAATMAGLTITDKQLNDSIRHRLLTASTWLRHFASYDPTQSIKATTCPVLAINGSLDSQVPADINLNAIRRHLPYNNLTEIREFSNLNHLFQRCKTGDPSEYGQIEETISPEVLTCIASWINKICASQSK